MATRVRPVMASTTSITSWAGPLAESGPPESHHLGVDGPPAGGVDHDHVRPVASASSPAPRATGTGSAVLCPPGWGANTGDLGAPRTWSCFTAAGACRPVAGTSRGLRPCRPARVQLAAWSGGLAAARRPPSAAGGRPRRPWIRHVALAQGHDHLLGAILTTAGPWWLAVTSHHGPLATRREVLPSLEVASPRSRSSRTRGGRVDLRRTAARGRAAV